MIIAIYPPKKRITQIRTLYNKRLIIIITSTIIITIIILFSANRYFTAIGSRSIAIVETITKQETTHHQTTKETTHQVTNKTSHKT